MTAPDVITTPPAIDPPQQNESMEAWRSNSPHGFSLSWGAERRPQTPLLSDPRMMEAIAARLSDAVKWHGVYSSMETRFKALNLERDRFVGYELTSSFERFLCIFENPL